MIQVTCHINQLKFHIIILENVYNLSQKNLDKQEQTN